MNLRNTLDKLSQLDREQLEALMSGLKDASQLALIELCSVNADAPAADLRRVVSLTIADTIATDLKEAS